MQCAKANTSESCKFICLFSGDNSISSAQIIQLIKQDPRLKVHIEQPTISSDSTVLLTHLPTNGLLVLSFLATVVRVTFQSFPDGTTSTTTSLCRCQEIFAIIQNIFVLKKVKFNAANICKEHSSTCEERYAVPSELINQVDARMTELFYLKDTMANLVTTGTTKFSEITKELQETKERYNEELKELYDLLQNKLCVHSLESGSGNTKLVDSNMELQVSQQNRSSGASACNQTTQSQGKSRDIPLLQTNHFPLTKLLHYFSVNLLRGEWHTLRRAISQHIPSSNFPANGIGIFTELVNRELISLQNLDLLHQIFSEIQRFDYVHLIDCVKEGDNSLLDQYYEDQMLANDTGSSNSQSVATVQEIRSSIVREPRVEDASSFQMKQDGSVSRDIGDDQGTVSQVSLTLPIQEVSRSASHAGNNHTGSSHGGSNRGKQAGQGLSGGNNAETRAKMKFSCEHYDRYCHVQFSCCDKFWPCHRCHNMENTCGNEKLRSIDIKKIKCRRCQGILEFPKERPNCEECGLKLAEYFCALCQHLTGRQSEPYHCVGCGICRINEDKSFHCDVCGVCLDIHLFENHECRAGSAHDKCCICFEDAFTGCQILPCSHKVHKDCATEMLKDYGITNTVGTERLPRRRGQYGCHARTSA